MSCFCLLPAPFPLLPAAAKTLYSWTPLSSRHVGLMPNSFRFEQLSVSIEVIQQRRDAASVAKIGKTSSIHEASRRATLVER
jgi:hypothetical protein